VEFRLLGPLEVCRDGEQLVLGGPKQRAVLAILVLHANEVVPRGRLLADVWGERAPESEHSLDVHISRLRKTLTPVGEGEVLIRRGRGYLLRVEAGSLDLVRFEQQIEAGERALAEGRPAEAARLLNEGLGLWRGEPLAEFSDEAFARTEAGRLKERGLAALEARIDADLELGREAAIAGELGALVRANPFRERLRAQLMLALYRAGRQSESLTVYADTRTLLIDELGIEPGKELRELQRAILAQDPGLLLVRPARFASAETSEAGSEQSGKPRRRGRRRSLLLSAAGLLAVAAALVSVPISGSRNPAAGPGMIQPGSVAFIDARSGRLVGDVPASPGVGFVRSGLGSVWEIEDAGVLLQINPRTRHLTRSISVGVNAGDVAVGEGAVWITDKDSQTLLRVGPRYGDITHIRLPAGGLSRPSVGGGVAVGAGSVWVAQGLSRILRINPASGRVESRLPVADANVVAFGGGAVWVASSDLGTLTKIDPRTGTVVATARIGPWICCVAVGGGYVWAGNDEGVWKLAPDGRVLDTITTPSQIANIFYGDGALWVAADAAGTVMRIDPRTDAIRRYHVGHLLTGIGVYGPTVAVSVHPSASDLLAHLSGQVLQVRNHDWFNGTDPAVATEPGTAGQPWEQQLQYATCARLLTYPDAPAPDGWRLVPEIAAAWPSLSPDGRTYTFRIRHGFEFSPPSGQMVTAATFKYTIERALSPALGPDPPALSVASDIAGLPAYRAGSSPYISGIRATKNTLAITLVRRAPDFPERIALSYFCPVPIGTPTVVNGLQDPVPSAGPYYLSGNIGGFVAVLRRNPNYRGSRPHRLAAIVYREQPRTGEAVAGIEAGHADYVAEPDIALAQQAAVARRFSRPSAGRPRRYFVTPLLATDELAFDTRHGLFADPRSRRAVSYALDRPALAAALGDLVTDHYLPPGMPAPRERHVYSLTGPDLRRARALAGSRTGRAVLAVCSDPSCLKIGQIIQADLERIGIHIQLRAYAGAIGSATSRPGTDIVLARIFAPYPDPVAFLKTALGGRFDQNRLDNLAQLGRRQRLTAAGQLELQLIRGPAPLAAIGTPAIPEFFSARVSCHISQPLQFGADLGSLCLRGR
jgi:DNA-binding SARP family transcriptional activator/ABC-type transport system substrate-binding protein/DNA-binding beta-propeller fold protein YncE